MNIAVIHHHLNRGGVAQVIFNHLLALDAVTTRLDPAIEQVVICYGGRREGWPDDLARRLQHIKLAECEIPGLDYDEGLNAAPQPLELADQIQKLLARHGCDAGNTLLHVHNHALGKNVSLPGAVNELAKIGFPLLLQLHDFAEDFRPANYGRLQEALSGQCPERLPELLYPQGRQIHYAVLNSRDATVLRNAGMAAVRLHVLPNPVQSPDHVVERSVGRARLAELFGIGRDVRYILYPTRGIRRKNLGEMLLWAAVAPPGRVVFSNTLAPLNPAEYPRYGRWCAIAHELRLPCVFESGGSNGLTLTENFAACDRVLTTSVAEGFGLAFLESCLSERPVIGRDLLEITSDFVQRSIMFAGLWSRLDVPLEWIGRDEVLDMLERTFNSTMQEYSRPLLPRRDLAAGLDAKMWNGHIDFGDLDAALQERVLRTVCGDSRCLHQLLDINPWLRSAITNYDAEYGNEADQNAIAVRRDYSLHSIGLQLSNVYRATVAEPPRHASSVLPFGERILDAFLSFSRFRPVRL